MSPHSLLFVHLLIAAALVVGWGGLAFATLARPGLISSRLFRWVVAASAIAYVVEVGIGFTNYPVYRIDVRAAFLDRSAVWASRLFDVKENLVLLAFPLVLGAWWLSRGYDADRDRSYRPMLVICCVGSFILVGLASVMAFVVARVRML